MQLKLCSSCARRIPRDGGAKCPACQKKLEAYERANPTREQAFYHTPEWKRFRREYLQEKPPCRVCLEQREVITPARVVDHIIPIRQGGPRLDPANVQPLCFPCHNRKSATEKHAQERVRRYPDRQEQDEAKTIATLNQLGKET